MGYSHDWREGTLGTVHFFLSFPKDEREWGQLYHHFFVKFKRIDILEKFFKLTFNDGGV